nr:integrase, catalytic region, zinc finger, CCHC-type, peptidase aspartic, catalytic [Tanacetum cinerariifolium]
MLLDTYTRYLQVINDLKKCGYSKDNCELNFKFLNNLQPEWKQYATMIRQNKNLMDINIDGLYNILKQNQGDVNDAIGSKKKTVVPKTARKQRKGIGFENPSYFEKAKDLRPTLYDEKSANRKQEFVKTDDKKVEKKANEKKRDMSKVKCYNCKKEGHFAKDCKKAKVKDYEHYKTKMLLAKKDKDEQVLLAEDQAWMELSSDSDQEINANIVFMAQIEKVLSDSKASSSSADEKISENCVEKANQQSKDFENQSKDLQDKYDVLKNQTTTFEMNNKELNEQLKELIEKNNDLLAQTNVLKDQLQVKHVVIDTLVECYWSRVHSDVSTHSNEALEIEKFKRSRENKSQFAYDYGNLNASYVNEKINLEDDYFQEIINPDFDKIDSPFQQTSSLKPYVPNVILEKIIIDLEDEVVNLLEKEKVNLETIESLKSKSFESSEKISFESENQSENDCRVVEKECDKEENPKVIAPGMFKLNVSQCVSPISMSKSLCDSNNVEIKLKRKKHLDTFSSVRRPKNSGVIWKKKGSSYTSNVGLSAVSVSNLNKHVKRYSCKDLLACNNSNLGETRSVFVCNNAMNVSCNPRMCDLLDDNNFFIFDDIVQIYLWIIDSGCSKHMTSYRALLTNFVEKFLGTICFGNNDFAMVAGYGDVVIGSMTIKKVYYVEGLGHN